MTFAGWTGVLVLVLAWAGPLPQLAGASFAAHMSLHMTVVGVGVPLLALGLVPAMQRRWPARMTIAVPIAASLMDFVVVWMWHAPALHHAAQSNGWILALEQASFAVAALAVWVVALTAPPLIGMLELLFTSMHMVLLGALIGLAPRAIYALGGTHGHTGWLGLDPLSDQHIGGAIMLSIGAVVYLGGGLFVGGRLLARDVRP